MRRLFDFECSHSHRHEAMVSPDVRTVSCPTCGCPAQRLIAAPRAQLEGISGDFPSAADKWVQRRESHMKKERKNIANHGTYK